MEMAAHEGLETLTVGELNVEAAAVTFDAAEGIQLVPVSLVVDRTEMPPVDLIAIARTGFDAYERARRVLDLPQTRQVFLQYGSPAFVTKRLYSLCNDDGTGTRALIKELPDHRFEGIQFAGTRFPDGRLRNRALQVLPDRFPGDVKLPADLTPGKLLFMGHPVNGLDRFGIHHHRMHLLV
jgi:hypothetical protein